MNDQMTNLIVATAMAVYIDKGVIEALSFLQKQGVEPEEAINMVSMFDLVIEAYNIKRHV